MVDLEQLREQWRELYTKTLPELARKKDPSQERWPVTLDHCFARIILDNTIGNGEQQWDKVIKKPAIRSMNETQFKQAIELGKDIIDGRIDLRDLDEISLRCRGKNEAKYAQNQITGDTTNGGKKRKQQDSETDSNGQTGDVPTSPKKIKGEKLQSTLPFTPGSAISENKSKSAQPTEKSAKEYSIILKRIQSHSSLTPYRKRLYTVLLSVPTGRYTTYAAMSAYLESSARAVGNGMRNNPFAPEVPCQRVLAADGSIGGFCGDWGKEGKHAKKKIDLLRSEGVRFDGKGKVIGKPFRGFHEFDSINSTSVVT